MKRPFLLLASIILSVAFLSCETEPEAIFPEGDDIFGLATPVKLKGDTTQLHLEDYFLTGSLQDIDSVTGNSNLRFFLSQDGTMLSVVAVSRYVPFLSEMKVWLNGQAYSFFVERDRRMLFTFIFDPPENSFRSVSIRGEMTEWAPRPLRLMDGVWQTSIELNPGQYQYLLVANGRDMLDPTNPNTVDNNIGGTNSLLEVGRIDRTHTPHLSPAGVDGYTIKLNLENQIQDLFVFWQNYRMPPERVSRHDNQISIHITGDALDMKRSFLRIRAYNNYGPSNDLLIPLEYGKPVVDPRQLDTQDKEATILYFMMVDRFNNGNPENDDPIDNPEVAPMANFMGGDLAGITSKIDEGYFRDLNVNTIWLSPITQNPLEAWREFPEPRRLYTGYHGYWPITLTTVDHRFGTGGEMEGMVTAAHENEISVMLDFVSNHVHQENPLIEQNPEWATQLNLPGGRKNIRLWDEQRLTTWFDTFLPSLDFSIPEVVEVISDSAFFWASHYNLEGYRHDATKHVPLEFWRTLTRKLREDYMVPNNKRLFQIGETFGSRELIGDYVGSGLLDGQFDFNLYFDARSVFAQDEPSFEMLNRSLHSSFEYYGFNNLMGNITGNHDMPRFISLAGGALEFDEDHEEAGWAREVGVGDAVGYNRLSMLTAFIMTIPGVPVIYYGDEIGIPGGGDPDSRRPMIFEGLTDQQQLVKNNASRLAGLRASNLALVYGDFKTLQVSDEIWAYGRNYFGESALVLFNRSSLPQEITLELQGALAEKEYQEHFGAFHARIGDTMTVTLDPHSFEVLTGR
ncbi:MAG: alpha-amylase family glycosyl hydrolase [Bacteroidales bacterium]